MPAQDPLLMRLVPEDRRFQYVQADDDAGSLHMVDTWVKLSDLARNARFNANANTRFHLFTRQNPSNSQVLVINNAASVRSSNFRANRRTVVTIHGWMGSATSGCNRQLVPAYLAGEDVNVIVVDWSAGNTWGPNAAPAARAAANFINWLNRETGARVNQYHVIGFSVGGHAAGILGRAVSGTIEYITGLDPSARWEANEIIRRNDGRYTEVIHTSAGISGWQAPLTQVDFYPNGGNNMPGCGFNAICNHERSFHYMAESLRSGGFLGTRCNTHWDAYLGNCNAGGTLRMGGRHPKHGNNDIDKTETETDRDRPRQKQSQRQGQKQ
ncbi:hypothetical protein ABMA27_012226 [Loxostege sticticalis]|uniref:Lipase domain-containing protein n=1 Tax=Loxostege sticticalis TaxID=481309 RepID=A0ABR3H0Y1_LOXSC